MHQVVMHLQGKLHDVADGVGVFGDIDLEGVFHGTHRSQRMGAGAHAADALGKGPGITRIAVLEDDLDATPHGAAGDRIDDGVGPIEVHFAAHVAFDARHRVHHHPAWGCGGLGRHGPGFSHGRSPCCPCGA